MPGGFSGESPGNGQPIHKGSIVEALTVAATHQDSPVFSLDRNFRMPTTYSEPNIPHRTTGTTDDNDDRDDEHDAENEAPVREHNENTETPEEFEMDDEDESGHSEDADVDRQDSE